MILSIIIVNYQTPFLTKRCIYSIYNTINSDLQYEIIVVDNNSQDDSENTILSEYPKVIWLQNEKNEGFGRANNIGIRKAKGEYILLLNSDIVVLKNTIEQSLIFLQEDKEIGVLGCKLLNEDGTEQKSTYPYIADYKGILEKNLLYDYFVKKKKRKIQAIMGSFMFFSKKIINEVGLFDPDFFMYSEEIELCYRIAKQGYRIEYYDKVAAIHKHGASSESRKNWSLKQNLLSNSLLFLKIKGFLGYLMFHLLQITNAITNFFLMWFLNKEYRKNFLLFQKCYFSNFYYYFVIPIVYNRKIGNGKKQLRRN